MRGPLKPDLIGGLMLKMKPTREPLPWYRQAGYKGNMTEAQKRELDALRMRPDDHPAAKFDDLPPEVRSYIGKLELQLYDLKQSQAAGRAIFFNTIGVLLMIFEYSKPGDHSFWNYVFGITLLVVPWFYYRYEWRKNADELHPMGEGALTRSYEGILFEWELEHVSQLRNLERQR